MESFGFKVSAAADQQAARRALQTTTGPAGPFAVIVADEDGAHQGDGDFLRWLRQQTRPAGTRIVLLTSSDETGSGATDDLADVRLRKPLRQSPLFEAVCHHSAACTSPAESLAQLPFAITPRTARILVAEDNEINQIVTTQVLSKVGYTCDLVANGKEALEALELKDYDLVLMDCQMPELDGFEATRQYRSQEASLLHERVKPVPIIALTANAMRGDRERCLEAGMTDYLTKPIDPIRLIDLVQQYLEEAM